MTIPVNCTPKERARDEAYNAQTLEAFKQREERMARRRKERAEARAIQRAGMATLIAGVKVGDVFSMSWGYDQTNVDFFQVVARSKDSVRVREVCPTILSENPGMMCATRKYAIPHDGTLLPVKSYSVFIKDQKRGDLKRIQTVDSTWRKGVYLKIGGHCAFQETGDVAEHYESWYA